MAYLYSQQLLDLKLMNARRWLIVLAFTCTLIPQAWGQTNGRKLFGSISCLCQNEGSECGESECAEEGCNNDSACGAGSLSTMCSDLDWCETYIDRYGKERQFPLLSSLALDRGYEIPQPFGMQATSNTMWTNPIISELQLGFNGSDPSRVASFTLENLDNRNQTVISRVDGWILPFLNIYGFAGHAWITSDADLVVPHPLPGPPDLSLTIPIQLDGPVYGGGATLAVGYENWFLALDANESHTDLGFDSFIEKRTAALRTGFRGSVWKFKGGVWAGAMYLQRKAQINGTLNTGIGGIDPVRFSLVQEFGDPWSYLIGAVWEPSPRWNFAVEGGLGAIRQITGNIQLRI